MKSLLLATLLLLPVSWAQPAAAQSERAVIRDAATRLMRRGVRFSVEECSPGIAGMYLSSQRLLTICHAGVHAGLTVETIAHEAVHIAQDCLYGELGDGVSGPIYWLLRDARSPLAADFLSTVTNSLVGRNKSTHALSVSRNLGAAGAASELEAYSFEHSISTALAMVEAACPLP